MLNRLKLSQRIFAAMFLVILFTSVSILLITNYSFQEQNRFFAEDLLKRKERQVTAAIDYELDRYPDLANDQNIYGVLQPVILGIADINQTDINVFDIRGNLMLTTESKDVPARVLPHRVLDSLSRNLEYLEIPVNISKGKTFLTTYRYIINLKGEPVAIVNLPYKSDNSFFKDNMYLLLNRFAGVMLFVLVGGGFLSWFMAKQITKKIDLIAAKIKQTDVVIHNKPIEYSEKDELRPLVDSYNEMLKKLNHQSNLLALTEREEAWRE